MAVTPAEIIQRRRAELGLSQEQLAERIGRTPSTVRRWESGDVAPPGGVIPTLARALQVAPRDLAIAFGAVAAEEPLASAGGAADPAPRGEAMPGAESAAPDRAAATPAATATSTADPRTAPPARSGLPVDEQATVAAAPAVGAVAAAAVAAPPQQPKRRSPLRRAPALVPTEGLSYLEDSRQRFRYWLRAILTTVAVIILLLILVWAFGEFWDALGKVWDLFGEDAPAVTAPGTDF